MTARSFCVVLLVLLASHLQVWAQFISGNGECNSSVTQYTNGAAPDSIFFYMPGQLGSLTATPSSGIPGWNFVWQVYDSVTNAWLPYSLDSGVPSSTISNLQPGGYRVTIVDGLGNVVGCDIAWVVQILTFPQVSVSPIAPGCGPVNLVGQIIPGTATPYYNPPPEPMLITPLTNITICFTANHTYVSDLGFYLVGPAACGSPTVLLAPSPGICNSGNNMNNLCFSNTSSNNFNVCTQPTPLSGTFGSYGAGATPINWSTIYGCDASMPGWAVQIYDCVGLDVGSLTDATLTFIGTDACGNQTTITYTTPPGYSSTINDNSCSAATASIFTVPAQPATALNALSTCGFEWTANPAFPIPNSTSSLNILLNPGPTVNTTFTLSLVCADGQTNGGCAGGNGSDSQIFIYTPPVPASISPTGPVCTNTSFQLTADPPGGSWSGSNVNAQGIINAPLPGPYNVTYALPGNCSSPASAIVNVLLPPPPQFVVLPSVCVNEAPYYPSGAIVETGTYTGPGINAFNQFDPALAGPGTHQVNYTQFYPGDCANTNVTYEITVWALPIIVIAPQFNACLIDGAFNLSATPAGGSWSGTGIVNMSSGTFDPNVSGQGSFNVSYTASTNGCSSSAQSQVNIIPPVNASLVNPGELCITEPDFMLQFNPPQWTVTGTGVLNGNGLFSPQSAGAGIAQVCIVSPDGCSPQVCEDILLSSSLNVLANGVVPLCVEGPPVVLTANFAGGTWSGAGITDAAGGWFDPAVAGAGTHAVTYDVTGVCSGSSTINITVDDVPQVSISPTATVCADDVPFALQATPALGTWSGTGIVNATSGLFNPAVAGPGNALITFVPNTTCYVQAQYMLAVSPVPQFSLGPDVSMCQGDQIMLDAGTGWDSVQWSNGTQGQITTVSQQGPYAATVWLNGCDATDAVSVQVINIPVINLGPDVVMCQGDVHTFNSGYNGVWSTGESGQSIAVSQAGDYWFVLANNGCPASDTVHVEVLSYPVFDLGPDVAICPGTLATFNAGMDVLWNTGVTGSQIQVSAAGNYWAVASNGPCQTTDQVQLSILPLPYINLGDDITWCEGEPLLLNAWNEANPLLCEAIIKLLDKSFGS